MTVITDEKALFEHSNPFAKKANGIYSNIPDYRDGDPLFLAVMAIAFELNKIRIGSINVDARTFDGDTEGWSR